MSQRLIAVVVLVGFLGTSLALGEDRKRVGTGDFYGLKPSDTAVRATLTGLELTAAVALFRSSLRGPKAPKFTAMTGEASKDAAIALENAKAHKATLEAFEASRGARIFRSIKLVGSVVLFVDAAGRVYEWAGSEANPTWSPLVDMIAKSVEGDSSKPTKVQDSAPVVQPQGDSAVKPPPVVFTKADEDLEAKLKDTVKSNLYKVNDSVRQDTDKKLKELSDKRVAAATPVAPVQSSAKDAPPTHGPAQPTSPNTFFGVRPRTDQALIGQSLLAGGELMVSLGLIRSAFTKEGRAALEAGELAVKKAKELQEAAGYNGHKASDMKAILADDALRAKYLEAVNSDMEAAKRGLALTEGTPTATPELLAELRTKLKALQLRSKQLAESTDLIPAKRDAMKLGVDTEATKLAGELAAMEERARLLKAISRDEAILTAAKEGRLVEASVKAELVAGAEETSALIKAQATRATSVSRGGKVIRSLKVIGATVLLVDALGRGYQWTQTNADPVFSPALTWAVSAAKDPSAFFDSLASGFDYSGHYQDRKSK